MRRGLFYFQKYDIKTKNQNQTLLMSHDLSTQEELGINQEILTNFFATPEITTQDVLELIEELEGTLSQSKHEALLLERIKKKISQEQGYISLIEYQLKANKGKYAKQISETIFEEIRRRVRKENVKKPSMELVELLKKSKAYKLPYTIASDLRHKFFPEV